MSDPQDAVKSADELLKDDNDQAIVETAAKETPEQHATIPQVVVRIPSPSHSRTLPKRSPGESFSSVTLLPQPHETLQELKLAVNEFVGGYWLGPYSLRIPVPKGTVNGDGAGKVLSKGKDGAEVRLGEKLSEWMEVSDVFAHVSEGQERVLEVIREPYSDVAARQSVLRLLELIMPQGSTANQLVTSLGLQPGSTIFESVRDGKIVPGVSEPLTQEVEVALPSGRKGKGGKKEVVKVKREVASDSTNPFADWKGDWKSTDLSKLPFTQPLTDVSPCLRSIQLSPYNPPPPHLRQLGHQFYLQITTLEGDVFTLICVSRGWYVSKSNVSVFDPTPRPISEGSSTVYHSLIDLLHSLSPQFSDRISRLPPLSVTPPALEPISTVAIPQAEPAYPWLASLPKPAAAPEVLRTQLAYLHTGATTADSLDIARDWNEEIQSLRELPKDAMQERVLREKMAQKTWAEFNQAAIRAVVNVARGDVPPLNPNEDAQGYMWLVSNIFITRAIDCIDTYAHLGGNEAAHVSHAKDAAGVRILNKLDVEGVHLLGHTVVDWLGERWVCQSMLPGIFSRRRDEEVPAKEESTGTKEDDKKEDWVEVSDTNSSPSKSVVAGESAYQSEEKEPLTDNHLIIYGLDSEHVTSIHWDAPTHKIMEKIGSAYRLAPHLVKGDNGEEKEFYASAEVKVLRGTDGRRYLLDLPRLSPVDIEWQEKDVEGKLAGPEKDVGGPKYPHRILLLRPELLETFWESELKRWARQLTAEEANKQRTEVEKPGESSQTKLDDKTEVPAQTLAEEDQSPAAEAAAAKRAEDEKPVDTALVGEKSRSFDLRFNADAFVDLAPARDAEDKTSWIPSKTIDESEPSIKAVRDASVFLRSVAIPAIALDVLTGNTSGVMDGSSLSRLMHVKGVNMRYLGYLAATVNQFSAGSQDEHKIESGHLAAFKVLVLQEMVFRASKHILRRLIRGLQPEHVPCAVSHFLNCLLGTAYTPSPSAVYEAFDLSVVPEPAYVSLTPESLRSDIIQEVKIRFRWAFDEEFLINGLRKKQLFRELATRVGFQLLQRDYHFERVEAEAVDNSEDDKENKAPSAKEKKKKSATPCKSRSTTFEPADILTMVPIVKSTAPPVSVGEEVLEAGRSTINRGNIDLGLEFMFEAVQMYENIHSVLHPEVAAAYHQYASTIHQLARIKIQQLTAEQGDPEQPLGLDIATALRLQRQAVIIAERTLGVYHAETANYYLQLAMLENLEGNAQISLRYFRHVLQMWDVIYGSGHPEINAILSSAGVVLQAINEIPLSLAILTQAQESTLKMFGPNHISTGQSLHQLTQAHFLAGDITKALSTSEAAYEIFKARLGEENLQTKEVGKNVELLKTVVENVERQKAATAQARERQLERLKAAQARVASTSRRRLPITATTTGAGAGAGPSTANGAENGVGGTEPVEPSRIGERGHLELDELVNFIQGQGTGSTKRGKNALRGKRRTGAKR